MPSNYAKGADRERQLVRYLQGKGWVAGRSAGSHTPTDVWAMKAGYEPILCQIKSGKGGPFQGFGPSERAALSIDAEHAGAVAFLVHWPPRKEPTFIPEGDWPANPLKQAA